MHRRTFLTSTLAGVGGAAWLARARKWADAPPIVGVTRLLINQTGSVDKIRAEFRSLARPHLSAPLIELFRM
jgi:hypothetical protein